MSEEKNSFADKLNIDDLERSVIEPREYGRDDRFHFRCYPGIACFTKCCSGVRINLTPYDIWRLKNRLGMSYDEFLTAHTIPSSIDRTPLPIVVLKMQEDEEKTCPFLQGKDKGCAVYEDRPSTCRYYPVGRAHMRKVDEPELREFYVMIKEDHCLGHKEGTEWTLQQWREDQGADYYDDITRDWLAVVIKAKSLGLAEFSKQSLDLFFMVSSNLDMFRRFVFESRFFETYDIDPDVQEKIKNDELELLRFSLRWLRFTFFGEGDFKVRDEAKARAGERNRLLAQARKKEFEERERKAAEDLEKLRKVRESKK